MVSYVVEKIKKWAAFARRWVDAWAALLCSNLTYKNMHELLYVLVLLQICLCTVSANTFFFFVYTAAVLAVFGHRTSSQYAGSVSNAVQYVYRNQPNKRIPTTILLPTVVMSLWCTSWNMKIWRINYKLEIDTIDAQALSTLQYSA